MVAGVEHSCRANYFPLLVAIYGVTGLCESGGSPETDLNEHEAFVVQHDQVNLATATSKVARYWPQALSDKIAKCRRLSAVA